VCESNAVSLLMAPGEMEKLTARFVIHISSDVT